MPDDVALVVTHAGGAKGKALLTALGKEGARRIDCPSIRRFGERMDFLRAELARAGRKADDGGLRGLIDAVGTDLRDLAAACDQLASDTTGVINAKAVARYWRGRAEASGFSVADKALEGNLAEALAAALGPGDRTVVHHQRAGTRHQDARPGSAGTRKAPWRYAELECPHGRSTRWTAPGWNSAARRGPTLPWRRRMRR
jgi:hypothetical protein